MAQCVGSGDVEVEARRLDFRKRGSTGEAEARRLVAAGGNRHLLGATSLQATEDGFFSSPTPGFGTGSPGPRERQTQLNYVFKVLLANRTGLQPSPGSAPRRTFTELGSRAARVECREVWGREGCRPSPHLQGFDLTGNLSEAASGEEAPVGWASAQDRTHRYPVDLLSTPSPSTLLPLVGEGWKRGNGVKGFLGLGSQGPP